MLRIYFSESCSDCSKNFLEFSLGTIKKYDIVKICCCSLLWLFSSYCFCFVFFLWKRRIQPFVHYTVVFCLFIISHNQIGISSTFLVFHSSTDIWSSVAVFLLYLSIYLFIHLFFRTASSSSLVNSLSLMSW